MKKALITGITGQDGYYLTKLLLKLGFNNGFVNIFKEIKKSVLKRNKKSILSKYFCLLCFIIVC